jgi:hypothetical protein
VTQSWGCDGNSHRTLLVVAHVDQRRLIDNGVERGDALSSWVQVPNGRSGKDEPRPMRQDRSRHGLRVTGRGARVGGWRGTSRFHPPP